MRPHNFRQSLLNLSLHFGVFQPVWNVSTWIGVFLSVLQNSRVTLLSKAELRLVAGLAKLPLPLSPLLPFPSFLPYSHSLTDFWRRGHFKKGMLV